MAYLIAAVALNLDVCQVQLQAFSNGIFFSCKISILTRASCSPFAIAVHLVFYFVVP